MIICLVLYSSWHRNCRKQEVGNETSKVYSKQEILKVFFYRICPGIELCKTRNQNYPSTYLGCQCDEQCSVYEDCCRDSPHFVPSDVPKLNFSCTQIPIAFEKKPTDKDGHQLSSRSIFGRTKPLQNTKRDEVLVKYGPDNNNGQERFSDLPERLLCPLQYQQPN